jgi:hypothetical protein
MTPTNSFMGKPPDQRMAPEQLGRLAEKTARKKTGPPETEA